MPVLNDENMENHALGGSNYGFSAKRIDDLGASEYTLVGIAADVSGSVANFRDEIEKCVKEIVKSCRHSPRADNLMLRFTTFDSRMTEFHGFKPLTECNEADYDGSIQIGGMTAMFDAAENMVSSVTRYGKDLTKNDFDCNAIVFVITDGADNSSALTVNGVKQALETAVTSEALESIVSILVGVNVQDKMLSDYLDEIHKKAGFTQYVELEKADSKTLAKLAEFVSKSISSQSQALGTGGPSQSLSF